MKKLLFLVLLGIAAWYGWNHYGEVLTRRPRHDAVIVNRSGRGLERVRLTVGGQTMVRETIAIDASATLPFRVTDDSEFELTWRWSGQEMDLSWRGGRVPKGPMVQRHVFTVDADGGVTYQAENKLGG